jgi:hypothetical protein
VAAWQPVAEQGYNEKYPKQTYNSGRPKKDVNKLKKYFDPNNTSKDAIFKNSLSAPKLISNVG